MPGKTTIKVPKQLREVSEKTLFKEIVGAYSADFFNAGDMPMLIQYVQLKTSADRCYEYVLADGEVIYNKAGNLITSPHLKTYTTICSTMATLAQKLRIAPSSRMRQEVPGGSSGKAAKSRDYNPSSGWRELQRDPSQ